MYPDQPGTVLTMFIFKLVTPNMSVPSSFSMWFIRVKTKKEEEATAARPVPVQRPRIDTNLHKRCCNRGRTTITIDSWYVRRPPIDTNLHKHCCNNKSSTYN